MTTATKPTERIVIVSGQEFRVPLAVSIADVRTHLAQTFPEVATATEQKGTKKIDGVDYETVEFVKRAGTKGLDCTALADVLAAIPAERAPQSTRPADLAALRRLQEGAVTIAQALDDDLETAISRLPVSDATTSKGATLCTKLTSIPPVAARRSSGW